MPKHVLACDEGTSSARAVVFDRRARTVATSQHPFESHFPQSGWVEQDAETIWQTQLRAAREAVEQCGGWSQIDSIGITNQRETTIVWDRNTGCPVAPAIVWQCRRTAGACAALAASGHGEGVTDRTGLVLDPYFSGTKVGWILEHVPGARERAEAGGPCIWDGRQLARLQVDWRQGPCHRPYERVPDSTNGFAHGHVGQFHALPAGHTPCDAAQHRAIVRRDCNYRWRFTWGGDPDRRNCRGPASGPVSDRLAFGRVWSRTPTAQAASR